MVQPTVRLVIRALTALFVLIALALVGAGSGFCVTPKSRSACASGVSIPIGDWHYYKNIGGQYFVFIISLLLLAATIAVIVTVALRILTNKIIVLAIAASGAVLCLINGCVEAYYTSGYFNGTGYVESWAAATAFYFLSMILYAIDAFLTFRDGY